MKITIEIGGNDYSFEMNRWDYKKLLADEEYAKMQNEITKRLKDKKGDTKKAVEKVQEEMLDEEKINKELESVESNGAGQ